MHALRCRLIGRWIEPPRGYPSGDSRFVVSLLLERLRTNSGLPFGRPSEVDGQLRLRPSASPLGLPRSWFLEPFARSDITGHRKTTLLDFTSHSWRWHLLAESGTLSSKVPADDLLGGTTVHKLSDTVVVSRMGNDPEESKLVLGPS